MSDREHALVLLASAQRDVLALRAMSDPGAFADEIFGFHAQQSVEKALKAWIAWRGERYPRSHDIMALIDVLDGVGEDTADLEGFVDLATFAVQYRYLALPDEEEPLDREDLIRRIGALHERVASVVGTPP